MSQAAPTVDLSPFPPEQLWEAFHTPGSFHPHLLTVYSFAVALQSRILVDLGLGSTTRALRLAARETGGCVYSADRDVDRFAALLDQQDEHWKLTLDSSEKFLATVPEPVDFAIHDAAHDYFQVKLDLELLLPKMRRFGLVCVHDTQQPDLREDMVAAIRDAAVDRDVSFLHLPFGAGLCILRVEESEHPELPGGNRLPDGRRDTEPAPCPTRLVEPGSARPRDGGPGRWLRWRLRKLVKGY